METQSFSLENSDLTSLSLFSSSTVETKKEPLDIQIDKKEPPVLEAKLSVQLPRTQQILDVEEEHDYSLPLASSKILFPTVSNLKYRNSLCDFM